MMSDTNPNRELAETVALESVKSRFHEFFNNKGAMGAIVNKAFRNLELKKVAGGSRDTNYVFHYFLIGHLFKSVDTAEFFVPVLDEKGERQVPSRFLNIQLDHFDGADDMFGLLENIRNLNSHYVHTFDRLRLDAFSPKLWQFIREAFELSSILAYCDEKGMDAHAYFLDPDRDNRLVGFWCEKFFPNEIHQDSVRKSFLFLTKARAMDRLLSIEVASPIDWEVQSGLPIFSIQSGTYLSFYASMVVVSLALYKNEANQLISKISGFKRNDEDVFMSKRKMFTGLSKRFSSQDTDHEQLALVKFRDIVQYLNHFPVSWNGLLEPSQQSTPSVVSLKEALVDMEIKRLYPEVFEAGSNTRAVRFLDYARFQIFESVNKALYKKAYLNAGFTPQEIDEFQDIIHTSDEVKGLRRKLVDLRKAPAGHKRNSEIEKTERELANMADSPNRGLTKLNTRLQANRFFASYGRNQDRFLDFALGYLLETGYFGTDAEVCAYQFYTTGEQQDFLVALKKTISKQAYDKLKFHQGKLVHFVGYGDHRSNYPEWEFPFVIRNNAVQIRINTAEGTSGLTAGSGDTKHQWVTVTIQSAVIPYLFEHALFGSLPGSAAGKELLIGFHEQNNANIARDLAMLAEREQIDAEEKTRLKKRIPKRLLHAFHGGGQPQPKVDSLRKILDAAIEQEDRYSRLLASAKKSGEEAEFTKRNKGKQFKLRFIRRAWHEMYFKASYARQVVLHHGQHHKSFHITREEFNDFSRWMFAFEDVPQYKTQLEKLFNAKGFFQDTAFREIFTNGTSLDGWYRKTKQQFQSWLAGEAGKSQPVERPLLTNYQQQYSDAQLFINLSEFIAYMTGIGLLSKSLAGNIQYRSSTNFMYLHDPFYSVAATAVIPATLRKRIARHRLEDALLYELAMHYLDVGTGVSKQDRQHVGIIQQLDVTFELKDSTGKDLYRLAIPFHKIAAYTELLTHKTGQETDPRFKGTSFLGNLNEYINHAKNEKEIKPLYQSFSSSKTLAFDTLHKLNGHLATQAIRFTQVAMSLEKYYIEKEGLQIRSGNRIDYDEINALKTYFDMRTRNKAFHFGVPSTTYRELIKGIEKKFILAEVKPLGKTGWNDLPPPVRVICRLFLNEIHEDLFDRQIKDGTTRTKNATDRYVKDVVN